MAKYTKEELRSIFQRPFDRDAWNAIAKNIFRANKLRTKPELFSDPEDPEQGYYMGDIDTPDHYRIGVFYYNILKGSVAHKKVGLRNLVRKFINRNWGEFDAALVVFNDGKEWRLSFVCDIKDVATTPKRFTFVFGESDNFYRTAIDRFEQLQGEAASFENIRKAFSVDALSDDFFDEYRELYADFVEYITGKRYVKEGSKWVERVIHRPDRQFELTFEGSDKLVRDYVKKMFGRIVFLYFLQRKGWLDNNRHYMHDLFYRSNKKDDFLDGVLEPLFFGVLNEKPEHRTAEAKALPGSSKIPYLNGGLFANDEIDDRTCVFPEKLFKRLFDFLDSYNFTIDENDTDDAEIGIDPEMLGRIFENLLEDNKDKGAFYTPKEIVDYMCKESIIAYLQNDAKTEEGKATLRRFVETLDGDSLSLEQRKYIKDKLKVVKICDPAIGSGAFPMGLVNILSKLYQALHLSTDFAKIKRHIMEQNIYGVDIEKGAVDIARLRFWLAMIVEEKEPMPLPNLHFKIMQGNSLLESYEGKDLSDLARLKKSQSGNFNILTASSASLQDGSIFDSDNAKREDLIRELRLYYNTSDHTERNRLFNTIINNVKSQLYDKNIVLPSGMDPSANTEFFLWHTWFADVFENGGFDIVIGNPPYVEARSRAFSEDLKIKLQKEIHLRIPNEEKCFPRGTDLLVYFYELALRILSINGINVFITQNAWLATDYGKKFQNYLLDKSYVKAIVDSDYKYFENADINTVITFFKRKNCKDFDNKIKFIYSSKNLKEYPCDINLNETSSDVSIKVFDYQNEIIKQLKWSVIFKSEQRLLDIINTLANIEDKSVKSKISIGQGLNLSKSCILKSGSGNSAGYYTSEDGPLYSWASSKNYVDRQNCSSTRQCPVLIMPRGIGTHFCAVNECKGYSYSYIEIYGDLKEHEILNTWLYCNSSLFWLLREVTGRTNLGGGMLKSEATDIRNLPLAFSFSCDETIREIYQKAKQTKLTSNIEETLNDSVHQCIDDIVFDYLNLNTEKEFVRKLLVRLYKGRNKKH